MKRKVKKRSGKSKAIAEVLRQSRLMRVFSPGVLSAYRQWESSVEEKLFPDYREPMPTFEEIIRRHREID